MPGKDIDAAIKDLLENTEQRKAEAMARARMECPKMTEAQLEHAWNFVAKQFGL